ncbi:MAG: DUF6515 family protein [Candidatus Omnitrophota bacterium]
MPEKKRFDYRKDNVLTGADKMRNFNKLLFVLFLSVVFLAQPISAFARPGHEGPRRGPEHVYVGHERYHYHDGRFYRTFFFGLFEILVAAPPIGAVVTVLPAGYETVSVGGVTYYYYDNIYYRVCPSGYVVAESPAVVSNVVVVSSATAKTKKPSDQSIIVNVPNSNGSYTPVTLFKQKDGYVGPQGEYYPGNPTVEQLKALYGK